MGFPLGLSGGRPRCVGGALLGLTPKQTPDPVEPAAAGAFGEKPIVTDAMKAVRQDMQEEAPDELWRSKTHEAGPPAAPVIFVGERDFLIAEGHEPGIGDGGPMGVAGEIGQHPLGSAEGRLGVDDEWAFASPITREAPSDLNAPGTPQVL
jgi:hypothetical protein